MKLLILIFCLTFSITSNISWAAKILDENPLKIQKTQLSSGKAQDGTLYRLLLDMNLAPKHHAYLEQFKLKVLSPEGFEISPFKISPTVEFYDKISKKTKKGVNGKAQLEATLTIPPHSGSGIIDLQLTYQACTDEYCLLPIKIPLYVQFSEPLGTEKQKAKPKASFKSLLTSSSGIQDALQLGWGIAFLLVFLAGVLTSFTPCIYPMIPITLAVLGVRDENTSHFKGFKLSLSYVFGIAMTYSLLGLFAASTGALFGSFLGSPLVVSFIALIFIAMAFSMFGIFEIKAPNAVAHKLGQTKTAKSYGGAFVSGIFAGVVASPCVGPVLVSVLTYVGKTQDLFLGFFLLFTFALGMGQIFIVLGSFSQSLKYLPKSGPWMSLLKYIFGFIMIGMAFYFLIPVTDHTTYYALIALLFFILAMIFGVKSYKLKLKGQKALLRHLVLILSGAFTVTIAIYAFNPDLKFKFIQTDKPKTGPTWVSYTENELKKAFKENLPVIIDFKADWCAECKELELYTFSDPKVLKAGKGFVWMHFDATQESPEFEKLKKQYDIKGLPFVIFYNSKNKWEEELTLTGFENSEEFLLRMNRVKK